MPKRKYTPSPKTVAARKALVQLSQVAKATKKAAIESASNADEMLAAHSLCINDIILDMYREETGEKIFKRMDQWNEEGYTIKKGSTSFRVWGTPKKATKTHEATDVKTGEIKDIEEQYKFWPMCPLFHAGQVEPVSQAKSMAA